MSFKVLATLAALVTVGTAGTIAVQSAQPEIDASEATLAAPSVSVTPELRPAQDVVTAARAEASPKQAWASRRFRIREGLKAEVVVPPAAAPDSPEFSFDSMALASEISSIVGMCTEFMTASSAKLQLTAHVIGMPESGAIVEEVKLSEDSESTAALSECLTESMYTLDLGEVSKPYEEDITLYLGNAVTKPGAPKIDEPGPRSDAIREALEQALANAGAHRDGESTEVVFVAHAGEAGTTWSLEDLPPELREMAEAAMAEAKANAEAGEPAPE